MYVWYWLVFMLFNISHRSTVMAARKRKVNIVSEYFNIQGGSEGEETSQEIIPWDCVRKCLSNLKSCGGWDDKCQVLDRKNTEKVDYVPQSRQYLRPLTCSSIKCAHDAPCRPALPRLRGRRSYECACRCGTCGDRCEKVHFTKFAQRGITARNLAEVHRDSAEECLSACVLEPRCLSVDYASKDRKCFVNTETHLTPGISLKVFRHVDYYFPNCTCPGPGEVVQQAEIR